MNPRIKSFGIYGLYRTQDIVLEFEDDQLILVGENGSGKSTVVSMLYYLLTGQRRKLCRYEFRTLSLSLGGDEYTFDRADFENEIIPGPNASRITEVMKQADDLGLSMSDLWEDRRGAAIRLISEGAGFSPTTVRRLIEQYVIHARARPPSLFDEAQDKLQVFLDRIDFRVLFLPTYRRIERELRAIFPEMDEGRMDSLRRRDRLRDKDAHMELVEFGMDDVHSMIDQTMKSLDKQFRASLDEVTSRYLRVIIRQEYKNVDISGLKGIDETYLKDIFQKIDKSVLSDNDQEILTTTIRGLAEREPRTDIDRLSAHIISKLVELHRAQYEREEKVRSFAEICNKYLKGKRFEFDNNNFTLPIKPVADGSSAIISGQPEISLSQLSSGEKQIVSLFSHLYLSEREGYYIIIDEPELSLSVPWQKSFLPDLVASAGCLGLVAVTHSPFIYANALDSKARSIQEFVRVTDELS